jgi:hypothetical protein
LTASVIVTFIPSFSIISSVATMNKSSEDKEIILASPLSGAMAEKLVFHGHGKIRQPKSPLTSFLDNLTASMNVNIVSDNAKSKSVVPRRSLTRQESNKGDERWIPIAIEGSLDDATSSLEDSQTDTTDLTPQSSSYLLPLNDSSDSKSKDAIRTRSVSAPSIPKRRYSDDHDLDFD